MSTSMWDDARRMLKSNGTDDNGGGSSADTWKGYFKDFQVIAIICGTIGAAFYFYLSRYEIKHFLSRERIVSVYPEHDPGTKKRILVTSGNQRFMEDVRRKLKMRGNLRFFDMDGCEVEDVQEMGNGDVLCVREDLNVRPSMAMEATIEENAHLEWVQKLENVDVDLDDNLESDIQHTEDQSLFVPLFKGIRACIMCLNWVLVCGGLFVAKAILIMLAQGLNTNTIHGKFNANDARHALAIIILAPILVSFLMSLFKTIFYEGQKPPLHKALWVYLFFEGALEGLGQCILVFRVLPDVADAYRAQYVMCSSLLLPAAAQAINRFYLNDPKVSRPKMFAAVLAFGSQVYLLVHMIADDSFHGGHDCRYIVGSQLLTTIGWGMAHFRRISQVELASVEKQAAHAAVMAASRAPTPAHREDVVARLSELDESVKQQRAAARMSSGAAAVSHPRASNDLTQRLRGASRESAASMADFQQEVRHDDYDWRWRPQLAAFERAMNNMTQSRRHLAQLWKSAVQMGVIVLSCAVWFFHDQKLANFTWSHSHLHGLTYYEWAGIQVAAASAAFYFGWLACTVRLQIPGYYAPLLLSTPLCLVATYLTCRYGGGGEDTLLTCDETDWAAYLFLGVVAWVSQSLFSFYTFFEPTAALGREEHLWFRPVMYCGALPEQSMLANRRSRPGEDKLLLEWQKARSGLVPKTIQQKAREAEEDAELDFEQQLYRVASESLDDAYLSQMAAEAEAGAKLPAARNERKYSPARVVGGYDDEEAKYEAELDGGRGSTAAAELEREDRQNQDMAPLLSGNAKATILIATTMWHEEEREMEMLLRSIQRIDRDLSPTPDDFESHVVFDNCVDTAKVDGQEVKTMNVHVDRFLFLLGIVFDRAFANTMRRSVERTAYGGRMHAMMPSGRMKMVVHLKDAAIIKIRKRMSQILYMNYFKFLQDTAVKQENTFLMTTDGDTSFTARSVQFMVDELKRDRSLGGVCGAIAPKGQGPMVWYQKFEYAAGHWFQKVAEDVLATVLCCPGCFSMFRFTAICKIMKKYSENSITAMDYLQMDMGEDRWMCTLLIRKGYRFSFAANALGETYAPEDFSVFFEQRRRWVPSTMANIYQLINVGWNVTKKYDNINVVFLFYTLAMFVSSVLGPGTVVLLIASGVQNAFSIDPIYSLCLSLFMPLILMLTIVWQCSGYYRGSKAEMKDQQISMSLWFSVFYIFLVAGVVIALASSVQGLSTNTIFLGTLVGMYIVAGVLHPQDVGVLIYGLVYLFSIPSMYLLLMIYSAANMHVMSWGTRDDPVKPVFRAKPQLIPAHYKTDAYTMKEVAYFENHVHAIYKGKIPEQEHSVMAKQLEDMRTNMSLIFLLLNSLWIMVVTTLSQGDHSNLQLVNQNAVGLLFLAFFSTVLVMQFLCLLRHRYCMLLLNISMPTMYNWEASTTNLTVYIGHSAKELAEREKRQKEQQRVKSEGNLQQKAEFAKKSNDSFV